MPRKNKKNRNKKRQQHLPESFVFAAAEIKLSEGETVTTNVLFRVGRFFDQRYGWFHSTPKMLADMVHNFDVRTFGQDIFIDVSHEFSKGAAAKVTALWVDGKRLMATLSWTTFGIQMNRERHLCYLSPEYAENFMDNETGKKHGALLKGGGLTIRPVTKHQKTIKLSSATELARFYINPDLSGARDTMNKELKRLLAALVAANVSEDSQKQLSDAFKKAATGIVDDKKLAALADQFIDTVKTLTEGNSQEAIALNITLSDPVSAEPTRSDKTLSTDDVAALIKKDREVQAQVVAETQKTLAEKRQLFIDTLEAAEGLTKPTLKKLSAMQDMITANMSDDQVKTLATHQIKLGTEMEVDKQLANMGWGSPAGNIQTGSDNSALGMQTQIDQSLKNTDAYVNGELLLSEKPTPFANAVIAVFDQTYARELAEENKILSSVSGTTNLNNAYLPYSFQRTVLREVYSDLKILDLVQKRTDPSATQTTQVPYEVRDTDNIVNNAIVFEGEEIPFSNVGTNYDTAYINAMKRALKVSNEVMFFTKKSLVNWNAWGENVKSIVRLIKEIMVRRLANEIQRVSDSFNAMQISNENMAAQLNGSVSTLVSAQFPVVRPNTIRDMQGNQIGNTENPIVLTIDGDVIEPWDGTGDQSSGTYYHLINLNLGHIQLVSEAQVLTPLMVTASVATLSYSYATNIVKWDKHFTPSSAAKAKEEFKVHLNGLLSTVGARKAFMASSRFVQPHYLGMSPLLNNDITEATEFVQNNKRNGTDTNFSGDLETIKSIPSFGTNAPGIDWGNERIQIGQRNTTSYCVTKAFNIGKSFEAVGPNGKPTGQLMAYGEEYNSIYTPKIIHNRSTAVIVYDSTKRKVVA